MAAISRTIVILVLSMAVQSGRAESVQLAIDGKTDYQIAVPDAPSIEVGAAAEELSNFLKQVTGAEFRIVKASEAKTDHLIVVGRDAASQLPIKDEDWTSLGEEGFIIRTIGPKLVIAGGPWRGTINGVYTFLEDVVGCQWYTPAFSVIPGKPDLAVGPLTVRHVPAFESRFIYSQCASNAAWAARQRLNTFTRDIRHGTNPTGSHVKWDSFMKDPRIAGSWHYVKWHVHTLGHGRLLPHSKFESNPEFFALVNGERIEHGQPCLTNPDLKRFIADGLRRWIKLDPTGRILSVSQGDFGNACQCDTCKAGYEDGGMTGAYIRYVNEVAEQLGPGAPDLMISTLAYQWTRKLPPGTKMRSNTVIRYAPIESCHHHALDECGYNRELDFAGDMRDWVSAAPRVWVWYYSIPRSLLHPYPNLNCLSRNFKLMRDIGIKGYFIQAEVYNQAMIGGLTELQSYLYAKLLWNPDYDVQKGIEKFAHASYGAAAPQMLAYIMAVNDAATYTGTPERYTDMRKHPGLHAACMAVLPLKQDKLGELDKLFDRAEQAVAKDPGSLDRVKRVRLSLQYALILYADPARTRAIRDFFPFARQVGVPTLRNPAGDRNEPLDEFEKSILEDS